jgi:hypothetical protein
MSPYKFQFNKFITILYILLQKIQKTLKKFILTISKNTNFPNYLKISIQNNLKFSNLS